jgi:hypothetical protein
VTLKIREENHRTKSGNSDLFTPALKRGKEHQGFRILLARAFHLSNTNHKQEGTNAATMAPAEGDGN